MPDGINSVDRPTSNGGTIPWNWLVNILVGVLFAIASYWLSQLSDEVGNLKVEEVRLEDKLELRDTIHEMDLKESSALAANTTLRLDGLGAKIDKINDQLSDISVEVSDDHDWILAQVHANRAIREARAGEKHK